MNLNVGCGQDIRTGWINLDKHAGPGVDVICDIDKEALPFPDSRFTKSLASHVLEHLHNPLFFMEELWRVSTPGAECVVKTPHGASDSAWIDPTHVRPFFIGSFRAFSQPYYHRADYGYRGDWEVSNLDVHLTGPATEAIAAGADTKELLLTQRNVIRELVATLIAIKPARPQR